METNTKEPLIGSHSTFQYNTGDLSPNGTNSPIVQKPAELLLIIERLHNIVGYNRVEVNKVEVNKVEVNKVEVKKAMQKLEQRVKWMKRGRLK